MGCFGGVPAKDCGCNSRKVENTGKAPRIDAKRLVGSQTATKPGKRGKSTARAIGERRTNGGHPQNRVIAEDGVIDLEDVSNWRFDA